MDHRDIMLSFWQQGTSNCVSIALIKAAIETFKLNNVFNLKHEQGLYMIQFKNGLEVQFTDEQLKQTILVANFQKSKDQKSGKDQLYVSILEYAQKCFAAMVAAYQKLEGQDKLTFEEALYEVNNGLNSKVAANYLGLEKYVSSASLRSGDQPGMYAWFNKHTVYMSHGLYDYYGTIKSNTFKYPRKIRVFNEMQTILGFTEEQTFSDLNYINISKYGTFEDTGGYCTTPAQVDRILDHVKSSGKKKLLIYFHGGLIAEEVGERNATEFYKKYSDDNDTHVLSIVWETGFWEVLPETLKRVLGDTLMGKLISKVGYYFKHKSTPISEISLLDNYIEDHIHYYAQWFGELDNNGYDPFEAMSPLDGTRFMDDNTISESLIEAEMESMMDNQDLSEEELVRLGIEPNNENFFPNPKLLWFAAKIVSRCFKRFLSKRDHGVWPTIVEESIREMKLDWAGSEIWDTMKIQAETMWLSNNGQTGSNQYAGTYILEKIIEKFSATDLKVDIVGHSAGSIAICECIKAINNNPLTKYSEFKFNSIVFLAPAVTCKLFNESIMAYPYSWERFRMFTMNDELECNDALIPLLYPRSLLYLISGILEQDEYDAHILGLHRHIRGTKPYDIEILTEIQNFLGTNDPDSQRIILSKSQGEMGRIADATSHKGFTFYKEIINSINYYLKH